MNSWNAGLEVRVEEADKAHRMLIEATTEAAEAVERGDAADVKILLEALHANYGKHFAWEEELMKESRFPDLKAHRDKHLALLEEFGKITAELAAKGLSPLFRLWFGSRLMGWLCFHIKGTDAPFYRHWLRWQEEQARVAEAKLAAEAKLGAQAEGTPERPGKSAAQS